MLLTPEMNVLNSNTPPRMEPSKDPDKSALSLQLDQFDQGAHVPSANTTSVTFPLNSNFDVAPKVSNERLLLRKLSKMISDEQWHEIDSFLQSPEEVAAYRSGFDLARSPPSWIKAPPGNQAKAVDGLTSSFTGLSIDMASVGGKDCNPMEIVHYACRFNPPRTIIRHLLLLYPKGVLLADKMGRLPLHYASKWGSSYRLIDYLIEKDPSSAAVKDSLGKTPLILICENYSTSNDFNLRNDLSHEDNMVEATKALVDAAPDAVNIEDNDCTTALEYAIASDSPLDAVKAIQKASERDWKERRKLCMPGETHLSIEEKLILEQKQKQRKEEMDRERKSHMNDVARSTRRVPLNNTVSMKKPKTRSKYAMTA